MPEPRLSDPRPTDPPATDPRTTGPSTTGQDLTDPDRTDVHPTDPPPTRPREQADPAAAEADERPKPLGLSLTQIAGGALAAVTAAVAASFLGVGGTLVGAAFGSVVSSIAAALYSTSLTRAARVSKVLVVRPAGSATGPLEASAQDPAAVPPVVPREPLARSTEPPQVWWARLRWKPVTLVAGLLFAAAMAAVSVSELALGHPRGSSTGSGTTLTNLGGSGGGTTPVTPAPEQSPTTTPSPSDTPDPTSSPTPSASTGPGSPVAPTTSPGTTSGTGSGSPTTGSSTSGSVTAPGTSAPAPTVSGTPSGH
jgi:hypothetical protein